jgi:signal peptide peptidase SppA
MPEPNFHACRIRDPDSVTEPRGQKRRKHKGKEYRVNYATDKETKAMVEQSYRYPKGTWTPDEARDHCKSHGGIEFAEATGDEALGVNPITSQCWAMEPTALLRLANWAATQGHEGTPVPVIRGPRLQKASGSVAVMSLFGLITQRGGGFLDFLLGGTSTEGFGHAFDELQADDSVDTIVINDDSPGGTVFGTPELADKIFAARGKKQVVTVANSLAASAAYWIGTAADKFYVTPGGQVGSIGVWQAHVDVSEAEKKAGYKTTLIHAGKHKVEGHPFAPLDDEARGAMQDEVNMYYGMFVDSVAKHRGVAPSTVRNGYGQGRVLTAQDALDAKMVDGVYTLEEVIRSIAGEVKTRKALAAEEIEREAAGRRANIAQAILLGEDCTK